MWKVQLATTHDPWLHRLPVALLAHWPTATCMLFPNRSWTGSRLRCYSEPVFGLVYKQNCQAASGRWPCSRQNDQLAQNSSPNAANYTGMHPLSCWIDKSVLFGRVWQFGRCLESWTEAFNLKLWTTAIPMAGIMPCSKNHARIQQSNPVPRHSSPISWEVWQWPLGLEIWSLNCYQETLPASIFISESVKWHDHKGKGHRTWCFANGTGPLNEYAPAQLNSSQPMHIDGDGVKKLK